MNASSYALTLLIAWTLALLVLMEAIRTWKVLAERFPSNQFRIDNTNLSPFMQRLARAHANCLEGLPMSGGLLLVAMVSARHDLTDPLAPWLVAARVAQSTIHLCSTSVLAVNARFGFFAVQLAICVAWTWRLLAS
jgi:hypothetical protein